MTKDPCRLRRDALASATMTSLRTCQRGAAGAQRLHVWIHTPPLCTPATLV
ncbi:hypothetical protein [Xanthomonas nasturtii]|uniref:hypothetical protein n=1 Tax=Xanthomonas nasturtii TaxID=1843581 RepID=UPI0013BEA42E|nr:hypothetical protein [Xanthomonas nasturtii]MCL1522868.1 hypothetical protein [Xanthomonas nasturtii]MCL1559356.1 hypothetical protein [Xanthomonas nasturtii]